MFDALADAGINIEIISTSADPHLVRRPRIEVERAVRVVHDKFRLSDQEVYAEREAAS